MPDRLNPGRAALGLFLMVFLMTLALVGCSAGAPATPARDAAPDEPPAPPAPYAGTKNPFANSDEALEDGEQMYQINCATCHGDTGMGDGPAAGGLDPKPKSLVGAALEDDYLFWRIAEGGVMEPFKSVMPAWKNTFSEQQIWQIITYLRSLEPEQGSADG